ncbi:unnamed protein product [Penicillium pancosmium]
MTSKMASDEHIVSQREDSTAEMLRRIQTADNVLMPIPRDVFDKLYLTPKTPIAGNLRRTFGNPTPICLLGFLVAATPCAMITMGWRGSGGNGGAVLPVYIFFGGLVQILGAIGEWIIGNTFPCVVFFTYGAFWVVQGTMNMPFYAVGQNYSPTGNSLEGMHTAEYHATLGFYYMTLAVISFVYLICSIRTNVCFFVALLSIVSGFSLLAGVFFQIALGHMAEAAKLQKVAGAFILVLCVPAWYLFTAQLFEAVEFPIALPVGDLSTVVRGRRQKGESEE